MLKNLFKQKMILSSIITILAAVVFISIIPLLFHGTCPVNDEVVIEAGSDEVVLELFKKDSEASIELLTDLSVIDFNKTGDYDLDFCSGKDNYKGHLKIVDTTSPIATAKNQEIYKGETLSAESFVEDIKDCSDVKVEFAKQPDFSKEGQQQVSLLLTDTAGNKTDITAILNVKRDTTPPVISGMSTITVRIGNSVSYRNGVKVTDNYDKDVKFSFDNSSVNLQKEGTYTVTYTATDSFGNTASATRTVKVLPKLVINQQLVENMAKDVLKKIITDKMTPHQKIEKIFNWVRSNMVYVSSPEKDIPNAAYVAFTKKRGDCFNYLAVTKLLLDGCGIQNQRVDRSGGSSTHYWLLVNVGTGWYHYDTTPQSYKDPYRCFMKTDAEVWAYAKSRSDGRADYYNFDTSKYPKTATVKYSGR